MMKKFFVCLFVFLTFQSAFVFGANVNKKKVFNKLDKQEQLSMLRSMRRQEISQVNSQIKDIKSSIKSVQSNSEIPLNIKQEKLLKLNRQLTELTTRKAELDSIYDLKISSLKKR